MTIEEIAAARYEESIEEGHNNIFLLLEQGLSVEEIKQRLTQARPEAAHG